MIAADSNTLINCLNGSKDIPFKELVVTDDLYMEYLVAEEKHNTKINGVIPISKIEGYDEAFYLKEYARVINCYPDISFARMSGFADISIVALVSCIVTNFGKTQKQMTLGFSDDNKLHVYTSDGNLRKMLKREFDDLIEIKQYSDL